MELFASEQFHTGTETHAFSYFGCHREGKHSDFTFRVWAPHARSVSVTGDFCNWSPNGIPMLQIEDGVFQCTTDAVPENAHYKYVIYDKKGNAHWKADPYAVRQGKLPDTSSIAYVLEPFPWHDGQYWKAHAKRKYDLRPVNIYELQLGGWEQKEDGSYYNYAEIADMLVPYCEKLHYTHIELMPICEYVDDSAHGYQITGYYAPTNRFGTPEELKYLIDTCHKADIGVILDWVAGDFPADEHALASFDGECCYEMSDKSHNVRPEWDTLIFDLGKPEVRSFLLSNAVYWIEEYHLDGIRIAAIDSLIYWDYGGTEFEIHGQQNTVNETAISFLHLLNDSVAAQHKNILTIAEDSSEFPNVTATVNEQGLGFHFEWNNSWTGSVIQNLQTDPFFRKYNQQDITAYISSSRKERYILPLSHNDVIQNGCTLLEMCPGNHNDRFANLRLYYGLQIASPGKKLTFMGNEFAQVNSWEESGKLDWSLTDYDRHSQLQQWHADLNLFYVEHKQLWNDAENGDGLPMLCCDDRESSVAAIRRSAPKARDVIALINFTPVIRDKFRIGLPKKGYYLPAISSDAPIYGGNGVAVFPTRTEPIPWNGFPYSAQFVLPPLSVVFYVQE